MDRDQTSYHSNQFTHCFVSRKPLSLLRGKVKDQVGHKVLPNGLQVLIKEDHRAPVAYIELRYKVWIFARECG